MSEREKSKYRNIYRTEMALRSSFPLKPSPQKYWRLINHPILFHTSSTPAMDSNSFASVTREEFHAFHTIDRKLYSRLIRNLGRNPAQSMQVVAVWLWLEQTGHCHHLVSKLLAWPDFMINAIADETVACLKHCIFIDYDDDDDDDEMMRPPPFSSAANVTKPIPSLQSLTKGAISLRFFKKHKTAVIRGVSKVVDEVCVRAFDDIFPSTNNYIINGGGGNNYGDGILGLGLGNTVNWPPLPSTSPMYYSGAGQRAVMEMKGSNSNIINGEERTRAVNDNNIIPAEERTIFLTFSKGYPVSKNEIKDFFTRIYGDDLIEAIHMQEVNHATEQSLYARLVVRSPSSVEVVLEGNKKARFSINKKHVRARKFVPNNVGSDRKSLSPQSASSPPTAQY